MSALRMATAAAAVLGMVACQPITEGATASGADASTVVRSWPFPVVWVEDHTGAQWPVTTAVRQWDDGTAVSVRYGRCRSGTGCIRVFERDAGDNGDAGVTQIRSSGRTMTAATVRLNDFYASNGPLARLAATCHEIGHGLGLPHNPSTDSCLYPRVDGVGSEAPDAHDRAALNQAWRDVRSAGSAPARAVGTR